MVDSVMASWPDPEAQHAAQNHKASITKHYRWPEVLLTKRLTVAQILSHQSTTHCSDTL